MSMHQFDTDVAKEFGIEESIIPSKHAFLDRKKHSKPATFLRRQGIGHIILSAHFPNFFHT